jgi:hypothetical protein
MGLYRTAGKRNSSTQRLAMIAQPLEPVRPPWWVSQPGGETPSQGWWWMPAGAPRPAFLGHNHIVAETALAELARALA